MLWPRFLAENKVYLSAYVYVRKGGVCTTLSELQKSRPQKCFVLLFQKSRFQNTLSPCTLNVFMLSTVLRKSLKFWFPIWRGQKGHAASGPQKRQLDSPDFLLWFPTSSRSKAHPTESPGAWPPAAPMGSCFGKEMKRASLMPLCTRSWKVPQRFHSYL